MKRPDARAIIKDLLARALLFRPPSLKACGRACGRSAVLAVRLSVFALMLLGGTLGYLSFRPISLTPYLDRLEKYLLVDGYRLRMDELTLGFDGALVLKGKGISIEGPEGAPVLSAFSLQVELSNHQLAVGRVAPKHVLLDGAALAATATSQTLSIAGFTIPIHTDKPDDTVQTGVIEWLNDKAGQFPLYRTLKTVELKNTLLRVELPEKGESWRFVDTDIRLTKYFRYGEQLNITTVINMGDYQLPAMLTAEHPTDADTADIRLRFDRSDAEIIRNHLPPVLQDRISGQARVLFSATLRTRNQIGNPKLELTFGPGTLDAHELYTKPLTFKKLELRGRYDEESDSLELDDFTFIDPNDSRISVKGTVKQLQTDNPQLDLLGSGDFTYVEEFLDYLPDAEIPVTRAWLKHAMNGKIATLSNIKFYFKGRVKDFPFDPTNPDSGYKVSMDFDNLDLAFMDDMPPARRMTGKVELSGSQIKATADSAILSMQNVSAISATIDRLFITKDPDLYVNLAAEGEIEDVLRMIFLQVDRGGFAKVTGRQSGTGSLKLPLKDHIQFSDAQFDYSADLVGAASTLPYIQLPYETPQAFIHVTDKKLDFSGPGQIFGRDVSLNWHENMQHFGDSTVVETKGVLPAADPNIWLKDIGVTLGGDVPFSMTLRRLEEEKLFEFDLKAPLDTAEVSSTLNWHKPAGDKAALEARGRISDNGQELWFDMLSFRADGAEVLGSAILPRDMANATIQLNPFKVGRTDMFVDYNEGNLSLMGTGLDVSALQQAGEASSKTITLPPGKLDVNLRNLYLPNMTLEKVEGKLTRDKKGWLSGQLAATLPEGKPARITLTPLDNGLRRLQMSALDAGYMLRALDLYDNVRGGTLNADFTITRQYGLMGFEGEGPFTIDQGHLMNAPIIARILALLWPGQLLSPQKGIAFDKIDMHLTLLEHGLQFKHAVMNGPSLGLRFDGKIDLKSNTLDAKGSIIPVEGLNKMVGSIPLVGKLLTGSQDALVAADFTVKGKTEDPQVFVNPLSVVTPGLVKDIFGAIFSSGNDDKVENKE